MYLRFTVPGEPVAQPRVKATIRGKHAGVYTPTKTSTGKSNGIAEYKSLIRMMAAQEYGEAPVEGPVGVDFVFVFSRPGRLTWKKRPMPRAWHTSKPDLDNCKKAVLDALKGVVLADDAQVCSAQTRKCYADGVEQPHTEIIVHTWEGNEA